MSKKPTKNQSKNQQPEIVDQQRDPMLRALQKKVRNINKKLNEIAELSARKDLKPEQEEKISKKGQVLEEREKYQEMIEVYKEITTQNEKLIRKNQIAQLEDLAQIIASNQSGANLTPNFNQILENLIKVLNNRSQELTVQQRVSQISEVLIQTANNSKLKASVKQYIQANLDKKLGGNDQHTNFKSEQGKQINVKVEEKKKQVEERVDVTEPLVSQAPEISSPVEQNAKTQSHAEAKTTGDEPVPELQPKTEINEVEKEPIQARGDQKLRGERRGRGRGGREGGRFNERQGKPYKKPTFKPKYEEQKPQQNVHDSDQSEDSEPKARDFKREEVKELINDGFIVVGKPKPKGRDQKEFHEHQHGKKFHPPHQKQNY